VSGLSDNSALVAVKDADAEMAPNRPDVIYPRLEHALAHRSQNHRQAPHVN
jgi:hypothetical protein